MTDAVRAQLARDSPEFRNLLAQHRDFDVRLGELQRRPFLSAQEQVERTNLKKYKLRVKDQIEALARANDPG